MGTNVQVLVPNFERMTLHTLVERLKVSSEFRSISSNPSPWFSDGMRWALEEEGRNEWVAETPGGFILRCAPGVLHAWHLLRWVVFLEDSELHELIRRASRLFAGLLGSQEALYLPEQFQPALAISLAEEGASFAAVQAWLFENCGSPTPQAEARAHWASGNAVLDRFYISDRFEDLSHEA